MQQVQRVIEDAVSFIRANERLRGEIGERLAPLRSKPLPAEARLAEERLFHPIKEIRLEGRIGGVDSGFVAKSLHYAELVLVRAVGTVFEYREGQLVASDYVPGFYRFPSPHLTNQALDSDEALCSSSLRRLHEELSIATQLIENADLDYCFLDGSVIPQYLDKPRAGSKLKQQYHDLLGAFQSLYAQAEKHGCTLVGCVEDSRGTRFRGILQENVLPLYPLMEPWRLDNVFDSVLLEQLLQTGERTLPFTYTQNAAEHPILMDFKDTWKHRVHALYLKPSPLDRPLRVEFIANGNAVQQAADIAEATYALSSLHREYAYPSVLIEADLRARLKPEEIDTVFNRILDKIGARANYWLRRDRRPF